MNLPREVLCYKDDQGGLHETYLDAKKANEVILKVRSIHEVRNAIYFLEQKYPNVGTAAMQRFAENWLQIRASMNAIFAKNYGKD